MNLGQNFNVSELPQGDNFEPLPAGWYQVAIEGAEVKQTKAGTGQYIAVRYKVSGPTHSGRVVFGNINLRNPNPKAEEIGRQQLGDICRAIGLATIQDSDQLIGGNLEIKLAVTKDETYGDGNDVKGFRAVGKGAPSQTQAPAQAAQTPPAAPAGNTPPWQR